MTDIAARIVIAEDESAVARPLVTQLEKTGHLVSWVTSVRELREEVGTAPPDLLVLDTNLDTDGLEYLQSIRFADDHPRNGVIVISDSVAARERGLQLGAAAALAKPVNGDDLCTVINDLLNCS